MKKLFFILISIFAFSCTEPLNGQLLTHGDIEGEYTWFQDGRVDVYLTIESNGGFLEWYGRKIQFYNIENPTKTINRYSCSFSGIDREDDIVHIDFNASIINEAAVYTVVLKETINGETETTYRGEVQRLK